jgi:hypothetical protein
MKQGKKKNLGFGGRIAKRMKYAFGVSYVCIATSFRGAEQRRTDVLGNTIFLIDFVKRKH